MRAELRREPRRVKCPKCGNKIYVPGSLNAPDRAVRASTPVVADGETGSESTAETDSLMPPISSLDTPAQLPETPRTYLDRMADIREEKIDPPPVYVFFSDVFNLPFKAPVLSRWLYMSLGWGMCGLLGGMIVQLLGGSRGYGGMAAAFFALPLIWVGLWTASYTAACVISVIEDTANGMRVIENWLEPNWKEWFPRLITLLYIALLTGTSSLMLAGTIYKLTGSIWIPWLSAVSLLFPFLLLSMLECDSVMMPFSGPVLISLKKNAGDWLMYLVLTATMHSAWIGLLWWGCQQAAGLTLSLTGPLTAAVILIDSRLLGRLGWAITHGEQQSKKSPARKAARKSRKAAR